MILPLSFFAASMSFASWAKTVEAAKKTTGSTLFKRTAPRAKKRNGMLESKNVGVLGFKFIIALLLYSITPLLQCSLHMDQVQRIVFENELSLLRRNIRPLPNAFHG